MAAGSRSRSGRCRGRRGWLPRRALAAEAEFVAPSGDLPAQFQVAGLDLRLVLAERFADGLAGDGMESYDIATESGQKLTVGVDDENVALVVGAKYSTIGNIDEAAYRVFQILHEEWQVIHPVFLTSELVPVPRVADNPVTPVVAVPAAGCAESQEQLKPWVEATLKEAVSAPLKILKNGDLPFRTKKGSDAVVSVRNAGTIEIWSILAKGVACEKARETIDARFVEHAVNVVERDPKPAWAGRGVVVLGSQDDRSAALGRDLGASARRHPGATERARRPAGPRCDAGRNLATGVSCLRSGLVRTDPGARALPGCPTA
jgi:hypothetical protein